MCGIAGILHPDLRPVERGALEAMTRCLAHRGPDEEAVYVAPGVGLGHRRLQVIDLAGSRQPMATPSGSHVLVYNGEVYDFRELRRELEAEGETFRTAGDTEVVLTALVRWGERALARFNGMFALALWDARERTLLLARDRMGEKPLHYARLADGTVLFGSELRALRAHPALPRAIDAAALEAYLVHEVVPAPATIFAAARKVLPAERIVVRPGGELDARPYWELRFPERHVRGDAVELGQRLARATARRLVSDVPLGVLLSGGVDSSTVAAHAVRAAGRVSTFSVGFAEQSFDESEHARRVARFLGTEHHEERLDAAGVQALVPDLAEVLDEPFADHSILPTLLLCRFTRRHVTVALGGDGGDELFAGYPTFLAEEVARRLPHVPPAVARALLGVAERLLPVSYANVPREFQVKRFLAGLPHDPALRQQVWLGAVPPDDARALLAPELRAAAASAGADPMAPVRAHLARSNARDPRDRLLVQYARVYLGDGILTKTDRASMSCSLEVRAPLLDPEVVEYAAAIRPSDRMRWLRGKHLLRAAVREELPPGIADRPKKGFGVPLGAWLRGPLRALLEDVLAERRVAAAGLVDPVRVRALVADHVDGRRDHRKILFALLVLHLWHARWA